MVTLEQVTADNRDEWRSWLERHHDSSPGVWLVRWKKDSGHPHLLYDALVEEALCFGWVDSQPRKLDAQRSELRVSPRRPGSNWSGSNKARVERMLVAGLMQPAGLAAVERAKVDGTWTALDTVEKLVEPDDLRVRLNEDGLARTGWDGFPPSARRAVLEWLGTARTEATRTRRLDRIVSDAHIGKRANQWRQPKNR